MGRWWHLAGRGQRSAILLNTLRNRQPQRPTQPKVSTAPALRTGHKHQPDCSGGSSSTDLQKTSIFLPGKTHAGFPHPQPTQPSDTGGSSQRFSLSPRPNPSASVISLLCFQAFIRLLPSSIASILTHATPSPLAAHEAAFLPNVLISTLAPPFPSSSPPRVISFKHYNLV